MSHWTDAIIGQRMAVDGEFSERVATSEFSNAEWELIMTATELEMENADDPTAARIVAETDDIEAIIPELDAIRSQTAAMTPRAPRNSVQRDGLIGTLKRTLGFDGDSEADAVDPERLAAAESLAEAYAAALQAHLEANGDFERARTAYLHATE